MKDILLDENFDLMVKDGDFVIGDSTEQNKALLLLAQKGEFRQWPDTGVGINDYLEDDELSELGVEIQKQFELDGMKRLNIEVFENGNIVTDGEYDY